MIGQTNAKIGSKINGTIKEYVVNTGNTIAKGDFVSYINSKSVDTLNDQESIDSVDSTSRINACKLNNDNTKFLITYYYSSKMYAVVVDFSSGSALIGTPVLIYSGMRQFFQPEYLEDDKVVVAYHGDSNYGYIQVWTISGTTIDISATSATFETLSMYYTQRIGIKRVNSTKVVLGYLCNQNKSLKACVVNISGTTVSPQTATILSGGSSSYYNSVNYNVAMDLVLNNTVGVIVWSYFNYGGYIAGSIFGINGNTIDNLGTVGEITSNIIHGNSSGSSIYKFIFDGLSIDNNNMLIVWSSPYFSGAGVNMYCAVLSFKDNFYTDFAGDYSNGYKLWQQLNNTATSLAGDNYLLFNEASSSGGYFHSISVAKLNNQKVALTYNGINLTTSGFKARALDVKGFNITCGDYVRNATYNYSGKNQYNQLLKFKNNQAISFSACYNGTSNFVGYNIVDFDLDKVESFSENKTLLGVAKSGGSAGDNIKVYVP